MSKVWKFKPCEEALVERLFLFLEKERGSEIPAAEQRQEASAEFSNLGNIPRPLVSLLVQRGCRTAEDISHFMKFGLSSLRDPFELPDMNKAVERIRQALADGEPITVFGDYDADGVCSTALLVRVLREIGGNVSTYIPSRHETGYGLSLEALTSCIEKNNPALIVTVDCGTNSVEAVDAAREQGIDVVITDHHEPGGELAEAVAVVNPKRVPDHPASILAGVGVAFKLCHALIKAGRDAGCAVSASVDLKNVLDFVAVATITDMVPLLGENRALVRAGFQALENPVCPGWRALKKVVGLTGPLQTWHAGFALGPRINAAGRVGRADAALELFLTDRIERAEELAQLLDEANCERQDIERGIVKEAIAEIDRTFDEASHYGLVIANERWHPGVIGIVASRLVQRYNRPVAVVGIDGDRGRGSCRSIDGFSVLEGLSACSDLLSQFGGHDMAAGLEIETGNIDAFKERFNAFAAEKLKTADLRSVLEIDGVVGLPDLNPELMDGLKRTGPFGQENPEPVWAVRNVYASDSRILKEKHLKLTVTDGQTRMDAIGFNMAEKMPIGLVDVAFSFSENTWNGNTTLQMILKDIRPAE